MGSSENEAVLRHYYEAVWNQGNPTTSDELISPAELQHTHGSHGRGGPDYDKESSRAFRAAFPDVHFAIEMVVDGGDLVAVLWRAHGTHSRTGKPLKDYTGVNIFRMANGQVMEVWNTRDDLGLYAQLGLIPSRSELGPQVFGRP